MEIWFIIVKYQIKSLKLLEVLQQFRVTLQYNFTVFWN